MSTLKKERPIHVTYTINDTLSLIIYAHTNGEDTFLGDGENYIPVHPKAIPPTQAWPTKADVACLLRRCQVNDLRINLIGESGAQYHAHYFTPTEWNEFCKYLPSYYGEIKDIHDEMRKGDPPMVTLEKFNVLSEDKQIVMVLGATQKPLVSKSSSAKKRKHKCFCDLPRRWVISLVQCSMREDKRVTGLWSATDLKLEESEIKQILRRFSSIEEYLNLGKSSKEKSFLSILPPDID